MNKVGYQLQNITINYQALENSEKKQFQKKKKIFYEFIGVGDKI